MEDKQFNRLVISVGLTIIAYYLVGYLINYLIYGLIGLVIFRLLYEYYKHKK